MNKLYVYWERELVGHLWQSDDALMSFQYCASCICKKIFPSYIILMEVFSKKIGVGKIFTLHLAQEIIELINQKIPLAKAELENHISEKKTQQLSQTIDKLQARFAKKLIK